MSGLFYFCLLISGRRMWLVISIVVLLINIWIAASNKSLFLIFKKINLTIKIASSILSLILLFVSTRHFVVTWSPSSKIESIASGIHISNISLLLILGCVLALLSLFYSVFMISYLIETVRKSIKWSYKWSRRIIFIFLSIVLLVLINALAYFLHNPLFNSFCFLIEGVIALFSLYFLFEYTVRKAKIKLCKFDLIIILGMIISSFVVYCVVVSLRTSIYVWDFTTYYERMQHLSTEYSYSAIGGLNEWFFSGMKTPYGCFLNMFIYPVFFFTNGSIQTFILSYFFTCVTPSMIILYCFAKWAYYTVLGVENKKMTLILTAILIVSFPLLHSASIQGLPDVFGLFFAGIIILLTLPYDFCYRDYNRWIIIFLVTVSIILTRRWYIFLVVGYYLSYFIILIIKTIYKKHKIVAILRNIAFFGISCSVIGIVVFDKLIDMIINNNYSESYSSWYTGGFFAEFPNQVQMLGIIVASLVLLGWIIGTIKEITRYYTVILVLSNCLTLFCFTRIQNMGHHQSLILFFGYFWGILLTLYLFIYFRKKWLCIVPAVAMVISAVNCIAINSDNSICNALFSTLDLYPHQRMDTLGLKKINTYFDTILDEGERVQVLAASREYDSEVFKNYPEPFVNQYYYSNNFLAPSEGFPIGFFDAQYVLVVLPIQERENVRNEGVLSTMIDKFYNNQFVSSHFEMKKSIILRDGVIATIYKRVVDVDNQEVSVFINAFSDYCDKYPDLFYNRLSKYLN